MNDYAFLITVGFAAALSWRNSEHNRLAITGLTNAVKELSKVVSTINTKSDALDIRITEIEIARKNEALDRARQ